MTIIENNANIIYCRKSVVIEEKSKARLGGSFVENTKKVFNILEKFTTTKDYVAETQKIIDEFKIF